MDNAEPAPIARSPLSARAANTALAIIVIAVGLWSAVRAVMRPFWYDEVFTVIVVRLESLMRVWEALMAAVDTNPPSYHVILRLAHGFIADEHLAYRLPSIVGAIGVIVCLYILLASRVDRLAALVGATFVLCTEFQNYMYEARPYALMLAFVSVAILAWSRLDKSRVYAVVLTVALALAVSMHYWAVLVWPSFALAEATFFKIRGRFRMRAWVAFIVGASPLLVWRPHMASLKEAFGTNFWARPSLMQLFGSHDWLFNFAGYWGWWLSAAATAAFLISVPRLLRETHSPQSGQPPALKVEEGVLAIGLLWLPVVALAIAKLTNGAMAERYMQPTVLGAALIAGYLSSKLPAGLRGSLVLIILASYALTSVRELQALVATRSIYARRTVAAHRMDQVLSRNPDLPLVISSGIEYLPVMYYHSPEQNRRMYVLTDPVAALKYASSDSVDLALIVLRPYFPVQVQDYASFAAGHRTFLLHSSGAFNWWPARLSDDGHTLTLLSENGGERLYKVALKP